MINVHVCVSCTRLSTSCESLSTPCEHRVLVCARLSSPTHETGVVATIPTSLKVNTIVNNKKHEQTRTSAKHLSEYIQ